jgi:hypothetical protein
LVVFPGSTAPISEGVRCYFANTAPENRGISAAQANRVAVILMNISENSQLPSTLPKRSDAQSLEVVNDQSERAVPK